MALWHYHRWHFAEIHSSLQQDAKNLVRCRQLSLCFLMFVCFCNCSIITSPFFKQSYYNNQSSYCQTVLCDRASYQVNGCRIPLNLLKVSGNSARNQYFDIISKYLLQIIAIQYKTYKIQGLKFPLPILNFPFEFGKISSKSTF